MSDSTSGPNRNIMLSRRVEDPNGYKAQDGKTYATEKFFLASYADESTAKAYAEGDAKRGYIVKQEGNYYFGVVYQLDEGSDKDKSQQMFDKLLGK